MGTARAEVQRSPIGSAERIDRICGDPYAAEHFRSLLAAGR